MDGEDLRLIYAPSQHYLTLPVNEAGEYRLRELLLRSPQREFSKTSIQQPLGQRLLALGLQG